MAVAKASKKQTTKSLSLAAIMFMCCACAVVHGEVCQRKFPKGATIMSYRDRERDRDRDRYDRDGGRGGGMDNYNYGRRPPNVDGMVSLKVDNLSFRITPDDIKPIFEKYGEVGDIYIPRDRYTKESRGFAFVRFYDKRDAEEAMERLDGYVMDNREMRVQLARYGRPSDPPRRSSYNNRRR